MDVARVNEEKLREACCFGDDDAVAHFVERGVNVNAQHEINGWTPLHWASKRGFANIAAYLLENGADKTLASKTGETPASVADKEEVLVLLGANPTLKTDTSTLPITPNYLNNPSINYKVNVDASNYQQLKQPILNGMNSSPHLQQSSDDELVLKIRIAHSSDPDFIEVELPKSDLTYSRLLRVCCEELGTDLKHILKIRKLPDTVIRKDKDVRRLHNFQELELVLTATRAANGNVHAVSSPPSYPSIPGIRNCTILY